MESNSLLLSDFHQAQFSIQPELSYKTSAAIKSTNLDYSGRGVREGLDSRVLDSRAA